MRLSDEDLDAKYQDYDVAGKFDYLKSYEFKDMHHRGEMSQGLQTNLVTYFPGDSMFDWTREKATLLPRTRGIGAVRINEMHDIFNNVNAFFFQTGYLDRITCPEDARDTLKTMKTFRKLCESNELDAYLAEGERKATERDPRWRETLKMSVQPPTTEQTNLPESQTKEPLVLGEKDQIDQFVYRTIGQHVIANNLQDKFMLCLADMTDEDKAAAGYLTNFNKLQGDDGQFIDVVGDIVLYKRWDFKRNYDQALKAAHPKAGTVDTDIVEKALGHFGFSTEMRDNAETMYHQDIAERIEEILVSHQDARLIEKRQTLPKKLGFDILG